MLSVLLSLVPVVFGLVLFLHRRYLWSNVGPKNITDVNIDCLEHILQYLEFEDLVNAADADVQLNRAADLIFARRYRRKEVIFGYNTAGNMNRISAINKVKIEADSIEIIDMTIGLRLLRCFGFMITKLKLGYQNDHCDFDEKIIAGISEHCIESLIKITIFGSPRGGFKEFNKPFTNVQEIFFENYDKGSPWWSFERDFLIRIFPKLRKLKLSLYDGCLPLIHNGCCAQHFPHLLHLEIISVSKCFESCRANIIECLLLNPQLKSFSAQMCFSSNIVDAEVLQRTSQSLQNLEEFTLYSIHDLDRTFLANFNGEAIHFKNVKSFEIEMEEPEIPFSFDRLQTLILPYSGYPFKENVFNFIKKYSNIKKLEGNRLKYVENCQQKLDKLLPLLEDICFEYSDLSADEATRIIAMFNSLKYFRFRLKYKCRFEKLLANINEKWSATIDNELKVNLTRFA